MSDNPHDHSKFLKPPHMKIDHIIEGTPRKMASSILARHLCGWITGHSAPVDHFLFDAEMLLEDLDAYGLKVVRHGR